MKLILGLVLLMLTSCASHPVHPPAPRADQKAIKSFKIPADKVRVVFYMGQFVDSMFNRDARWPMDVYIGNRMIGNLGQRSDMIAADLSSGSYTFKAVGPDPARFVSKPLKLDLKPGKQYFLKTTETDAHAATNEALDYDYIVSLEQDSESDGHEAVSAHTLIGYYTDSISPPEPKKVNHSAVPPVQQPAVATPMQKKQLTDIEYKLKTLKSMYEQNLITKDEYDQKRKTLLNDF